MHVALISPVVALALSAAATPQPTPKEIGTSIPIIRHPRFINDAKTLDIDVLKRDVAAVERKIRRGSDNFKKNTGVTHPFASERVEKRGYPEPLVNDYNSLVYGNVSVGTPPVPFQIVFDTGSSDFFLPRSDCASCSGHTLWNPASSATSADLGRTFSLGFAGGAIVSGEEYTDTVAIGSFAATSQTLGAATSYSEELQGPSFPADGLMGLAFPSISHFGASPFIQTLVSEGQMPESVFSFKLSAAGAELYLGGTDEALYTGDFSYASVTHAGFWQIAIDNIQGNGQTILYNLPALVDTASLYIYGPSSPVSRLHTSLGCQAVSYAPQFYGCPCNSFPNISLTLGGTSFQIPSSTLNLGTFGGIPPTECVGAIVSMQVFDSLWVVGNVFLSSVYVSFDVGNLRVGFAQLA